MPVAGRTLPWTIKWPQVLLVARDSHDRDDIPPVACEPIPCSRTKKSTALVRPEEIMQHSIHHTPIQAKRTPIEANHQTTFSMIFHGFEPKPTMNNLPRSHKNSSCQAYTEDPCFINAISSLNFNTRFLILIVGLACHIKLPILFLSF
jgi:hypothetical protein